MKKLLVGIILMGSFIAITGTAIAYKVSKVPVRASHYHANFAIFIQGKRVDFSKPSYMTIQPCTDDVHHSADPHENVHLHDQVGNVVHLHMDGINWKTFFQSLDFDLSSEIAKSSESGKLITTYYVDGTRTDASILESVIKQQSRLLIHVATQSGIQNVADDSVIAKEYEETGTNASEYDEGKIGIEKCGSQGDRSYWQRFKIAFSL